jgi:ferritin-like metal-binding protein YciE
MENNNANPLNESQLRAIFVHHLNRIYFGKRYLDKTIDEIIGLASFKNLELAIQEIGEDAKRQIIRMEDIYRLIDETPTDESHNPIKSIVGEEFFIDQTLPIPILKDTDIMLYIQLLEHINITSYRMLKTIASAQQNTAVEQLLVECFDESVDDDGLFVLIAGEYLTAK